MQKFHTIGWQGITVNVPEGWHLAYGRGTLKDGYFRLDDEKRERRFEVRWLQPRKNMSLTTAMKRFGMRLRRRARRSGQKLRVSESPLPFTSRSLIRNREVHGFSWSTDIHAWGAIWRCRECGRIVAAHVLFHGREKNFTLVKLVLSSLQDHPRPEGVLWSAHGLHFHLPPRFKLKRWRFKAGSSRMEFRARRRNQLVIRCQSIAPSDHGASSLSRLAARELKRKSKRRLGDAKARSVLSHEGLAFAERKAKRRIRSAVRKARKPFYGVVFYCPQRGKKFAIIANDRRRTVIGKVLSGFECHV